MDTIIVTMIRRPPKADPKQRSLEESGTANLNRPGFAGGCLV